MSDTFDRDIDADQAVCDAATPAPWEWDEDEDVMRLMGAGDQGFHGDQILKAPKRGTPYAEYWPETKDAAFIAEARTALPAYIAEVRRLRAINIASMDTIFAAFHLAEACAALIRAGHEDGRYLAICQQDEWAAAVEKARAAAERYADRDSPLPTVGAEVTRLAAENASLEARLARALQDLEAANDQP